MQLSVMLLQWVAEVTPSCDTAVHWRIYVTTTMAMQTNRGDHIVRLPFPSEEQKANQHAATMAATRTTREI